MDLLRNIVRSVRKKPEVDPAETEKLQEFKNTIGNDELKLKDLKLRYEHNFTYRLEALNGVHDLLQDFQQDTISIGQYFTMKSILKAWIAHYTKIIRFIVRIVDSGPVKDNVDTFKEKVTNCAMTLIMVLDVRHDIISLVHEFLKATYYSENDKFTVHVFWKAKTAADLIIKTVEPLSNRLIVLGLGTMSNILTRDMFNSLIEHSHEIEIEKLPNLHLLQGRLFMVLPIDSIMIHSPRPPIMFDDFPDVRCSKM